MTHPRIVDESCVTFLMLTYDQAQTTIAALRSLSKVGWPVAVHILDNGKGLDAQSIEDEFVGEISQGLLRVATAPRNLGVAGGRNQLARECVSDWYVFVDNDVLFTDQLRGFCEEVKSAPSDLVFPIIASKDGLTWSAGGTYNRILSWSRNGYHGRSLDAPTIDLDGATDWGAGACLAVRRSAFWSLGGFDEGFGDYGAEDLDLGLRARASGFSSVRSARVPLIHFDLKTSLVPESRSSALRDAQAVVRRRHCHPLTRPAAAMVRSRLVETLRKRAKVRNQGKQ